jgi:hypothetical protein
MLKKLKEEIDSCTIIDKDLNILLPVMKQIVR